jgi:DNA (cytosine-5)-methyltransferase 1
MKIGSLFTGYGGLDLAVEQTFGAETAWTSDIDPGASKIISHRFPDAPNLGDITKINWSDVEPVDIITGGFPCQDLSHAGKRAGMNSTTRSGLWSHMAEAVNQLRPRYVVAENVRGLLSADAHSDLEPCPWCLGDSPDRQSVLRALGCVLGDLADIGYDTQWVGIRAADVGAPHGRFRVFILAIDATVSGLQGPTVRRIQPSLSCAGRGGSGHAADASGKRHGRGEDTRRLGRVDGEDESCTWERERSRQVASDRSATTTAADADSDGQQSVRRLEPIQCDTDRRRSEVIAWGAYEPAIRRWESATGRTAPAPTEASAKGSQRLSPAFVEWMMGLPAGWVTDVPGLNRNAQLKALGNGVVPQQAAAALKIMLAQQAVAA